jgi:hypothetical protein
MEFLYFCEVRYREIWAIYDAFDTRKVWLFVRADVTGCGKTPEEKKTVPSAAKAALILIHLCTA